MPVVSSPVLRRAAMLCILAAAASTTPAAARLVRHTQLLRSSPAAHDTLTVSPKMVQLWFSEPVEISVTRVKLADAAGAPVKLGHPSRAQSDSAPVVAMIATPLVPGSYTVTWSTAAKDGHPAKGSFAFVVKPRK